MLTALQIGTDRALLMSRTGVLAKAGFRVIAAHAWKDAAARIATETFDAAILCHSLERTERRKLAAWVRLRNPEALVLLVAERETNLTPEDGIDAVLDPAPLQLIAQLQQLLPGAGPLPLRSSL